MKKHDLLCLKSGISCCGANGEVEDGRYYLAEEVDGEIAEYVNANIEISLVMLKKEKR